MNTYIVKVHGIQQPFRVPANNIAEAYITVQSMIPAADIDSIESSGKMLREESESWLTILAEFLVKNASVDDIAALTNSLASEELIGELVTAIWNVHHANKRIKSF